MGIVGWGHWARDAYLPYLVGFDDIELAALCDQNQDRAGTLAAAYRTARKSDQEPAIHTEYEWMFADQELDLVVVSTLAHVRPAITIAALQAGLHVLAAKPMAPSLAEAEQMLVAAAAANRVLMVGYNYRFREDAGAVKQFIRDGGIGDPIFARAWIHAPGVPSYAPHYVSSLSAGGALASTGVHPLDLALWFLDCPSLRSVDGQARSRFHALTPLPDDLEAIRADYATDDLVSGWVRFAGDITLTTESVWMAPPAENVAGVEVWGTRGHAALSPLRLFSWGDGDWVDRTEEVAPGLAASFVDSDVRVGHELRHFIEVARGREEPFVTPREMWTVQAILDALYTGRREFLEDDLPAYAR